MLPLTPVSVLVMLSVLVLSPVHCAVFASNGAELNGYGHKLAHQRGIPHEHVRPIPHHHLLEHLLPVLMQRFELGVQLLHVLLVPAKMSSLKK